MNSSAKTLDVTTPNREGVALPGRCRTSGLGRKPEESACTDINHKANFGGGRNPGWHLAFINASLTRQLPERQDWRRAVGLKNRLPLTGTFRHSHSPNYL